MEKEFVLQKMYEAVTDFMMQSTEGQTSGLSRSETMEKIKHNFKTEEELTDFFVRVAKSMMDEINAEEDEWPAPEIAPAFETVTVPETRSSEKSPGNCGSSKPH